MANYSENCKENVLLDNGTCIMCFRAFVYENACVSESIGKIFTVCSNYLTGDVSPKISKWNKLNVKEKISPFCQYCTISGEKLLEMQNKLQEIQNELENFVQSFSTEIRKFRNEENQRTESSEQISEIKYENLVEEVIKCENREDAFKCEPDFIPSPSSLNDDYLENDFTDDENKEKSIRKQKEQEPQEQEDCFKLKRFPRVAKSRIERIEKSKLMKNCEDDEQNSDDDFSDPGFRGSSESSEFDPESDMDHYEPKKGKAVKRKRKVKKGIKGESLFNCQFCISPYSSRVDFENHMRKMHENEKIFECLSCDYKSTSVKDYTMHIRRHEKCRCCEECEESFNDRFLYDVHCMEHRNEIPFECQSCHEKFSQVRDFSYHQKFSSCAISYGEFKCKSCGQTFHAQYLLILHQVWDHDCFDSKNSSGDYECHLCTGILTPTTARPRLEVHFLSHTKESPLSCDICGMPMRCPYVLKGHRLTHKAKENREKIPCPQCDLEFNRNRTLRLHIRRKHNESAETLICTFENCRKSFKIQKDYERHIKIHTDRHPCDICEKTFGSISALNGHKDIHTNNLNFKCTECDKAFNFASKLKAHVATVHENLRNFVCDICGRSFVFNYKYRRHLKSHEGGKEKEFVCNICGHPFTRDYYLKDHMRIHTGEPEDRSDYQFICDVCGKQFRCESSVKDHKRRHHSSNPPKNQVQCTICGKNFARKRNLTLHMTRKHDTNTEKFQCKICGRILNLEGEFSSHMKSHSIQIPCGICEKSFSTGAQVKAHRLTHNGASFSCHQCSKSFTTPYKVKQHIENVHLKKKNHFCPICGKGFYLKPQYRAHLGTHSEEKSFVCGNCGDKFNTQHKLVDHKRRDHSDGPFNCHICAKSFLRKTTLNLHIKKHNKIIQ